MSREYEEDRRQGDERSRRRTSERQREMEGPVIMEGGSVTVSRSGHSIHSARSARSVRRVRSVQTSGNSVNSGSKEAKRWRTASSSPESGAGRHQSAQRNVSPSKNISKSASSSRGGGNYNNGGHGNGGGRNGGNNNGYNGNNNGNNNLPNPRKEMERAKKRRTIRRIITTVIAECFALFFIFGYGFFARTAAKIQRPSEEEMKEVTVNQDLPEVATQNMKGYWTIAVFGVDARDNAIKKDTNADVNIICSINLENGEIKLVSVYRDSYLNISQEKGSYNKINQAYFLGGPAQAMTALNRNLDLNITDYITFNWKAVAQGIDILGGVDVELSKAEFYYINSFITETVKATGIGSTQLTHAGMNHLDGVQAVAYGRLRLMDTDYARTERQRKIISLAFEKAQKADFQTLYRLIGTVFPNTYTSLWVDDLVNNAKNISKFHLVDTTGFPQARGEANMGKRGSVVVPATLESNVKLLHEFLYDEIDYEPSETVKKIGEKISADTGIYKEGQVVKKVGTDSGVVQPQKTTASATTGSSKNSKDESGINDKKDVKVTVEPDDSSAGKIFESTKADEKGSKDSKDAHETTSAKDVKETKDAKETTKEITKETTKEEKGTTEIKETIAPKESTSASHAGTSTTSASRETTASHSTSGGTSELPPASTVRGEGPASSTTSASKETTAHVGPGGTSTMPTTAGSGPVSRPGQ